MTLAANPLAQQERAWWDAHTAPECVWGAEGDGVAACYRIVDHGLGEPHTGGLVVDLGCGPGRLLVPYAKRHPEVSVAGVDVSRRMLDLIDLPDNADVVLGDGRTIPFVDGTVDSVWSVLMFQHVPPAAQHGYVAEVGRVLRPGGRFVVQVLPGDREREQAGTFLNHPVDVEALRETGRSAGLVEVETIRGAVLPEWSWLVFEANERS